jgi:hypothetical protein
MIVVASARAIELKRQKGAHTTLHHEKKLQCAMILSKALTGQGDCSKRRKVQNLGNLHDMWMRRLRRISTCGTALLELIRCSWFPELVFGIEIYPLRVRIQQLADKFFACLSCGWRYRSAGTTLLFPWIRRTSKLMEVIT